jgi:phenylpropionate dioxygenase-like ring-hydroxylating dioxygenase large terminal subunit
MASQLRPEPPLNAEGSAQEIVRRDTVPARAPLDHESPAFLGDEDIPFERYTSREFFEQELRCVWAKAWQWACREEHVREPGDYVVYDIGRHSVIVVRTESGAIKGYVNSCLHRGTRIKEGGSDGHSPELRCPYHGWTWSLGGELQSLRCRWDFPHVKPESFRLPEVRVATWGGFVFVNLDPSRRTSASCRRTSRTSRWRSASSRCTCRRSCRATGRRRRKPSSRTTTPPRRTRSCCAASAR